MKDVFEIDSYMEHDPWASFLPGIAGEEGIPLWCMYVNRGQAVVSFGAGDKDHAIMEFYRKEIYPGISGEKEAVDAGEVRNASTAFPLPNTGRICRKQNEKKFQ